MEHARTRSSAHAGPVEVAVDGGGGGGRGQLEHNGPAPEGGVPFVAGGGRGGGGGGGGFGGGAPQGPLLEPGTFMVRLTVGGETRMSSVDLLDDIWMRPQ